MIMENVLVNSVDGESYIQTGNNNMFYKNYSYEPQDNITLFELALIMPLFQSSSIYAFNAGVEQLPETVKRHFKRT